MTVSLFLLLLALGAFVGVMAGLLGIGGGLIVVPALLFLLPWAGISPEMSMHMRLRHLWQASSSHQVLLLSTILNLAT